MSSSCKIAEFFSSFLENQPCCLNVTKWYTLLLTFTSCYHRYISRSATDIKYNRSLNPWNEEMSSFTSDIRFNALKSIKYYSSVTSFNCNKKILTIENLIFSPQHQYQNNNTGWENFEILSAMGDCHDILGCSIVVLVWAQTFIAIPMYINSYILGTFVTKNWRYTMTDLYIFRTKEGNSLLAPLIPSMSGDKINESCPFPK